MYGITGNELDWFSSYLKSRKQTVFFQQDSSYYLLMIFRILQRKGAF